MGDIFSAAERAVIQRVALEQAMADAIALRIREDDKRELHEQIATAECELARLEAIERADRRGAA